MICVTLVSPDLDSQGGEGRGEGVVQARRLDGVSARSQMLSFVIGNWEVVAPILFF